MPGGSKRAAGRPCLFVTQRVDWIEVRRLGRRQDAEQHADEAGESERQGDGPQGDAGGRKGIDAARNYSAEAVAEGEADQAAEQ